MLPALYKSFASYIKLYKPFISIGAVCFIFFLFFIQLEDIYSFVKLQQFNTISNLTKKDITDIQKDIFSELYKDSLNKYLYRYSVFFYLDNYKTRALFLNSDSHYSIPKNINTDSDLFYKEMLVSHKANLCFIKLTKDLDKNSYIYRSLLIKKDISYNKFYVSCPIFIEQTLVGYLGGIYIINGKHPSASSIDLNPIKKAADSIKNIILSN
jgi:hypothetical protein